MVYWKVYFGYFGIPLPSYPTLIYRKSCWTSWFRKCRILFKWGIWIATWLQCLTLILARCRTSLAYMALTSWLTSLLYSNSSDVKGQCKMQTGTQTKRARIYGIARGGKVEQPPWIMTRYTSCCIPLCKNNFRNSPGLAFYRIPKARRIQREYVRLLRNWTLI